ncbi:MAG: FliM/FliN family flagellar motor switch protein [Acidimicrobiia bacterium]
MDVPTVTTATSPRPRVEAEQEAAQFDFRSPGKLAREYVRSLEVAHETFARRFASGLTNALRSVVHLELTAVQQLTYEDYSRSTPNPTVMGVIGLPPLPGAMLIEMNAQMGLTLVDRMLGGTGRPVSMRRPTELEAALLRDILKHAVGALRETLGPLADVEPETGSVELNPHLVQAVSPSEMVLVLCYSVAVSHGTRSDGLLTLCYPFTLLQPLVERLGRHAWDHEQPSQSDSDPLTARIEEQLSATDVTASVHLRPAAVEAASIAALQPGDVLRLDHRVGEPALVSVAGMPLLECRLGRRGSRRAVQISSWRNE